MLISFKRNIYNNTIIIIIIIFYYLSFFSLTFSRQQEKRDAISLTPSTRFTPQFHPLYRYLDISQGIAAESSPLHVASNQTRTEKPPFVASKADVPLSFGSFTIWLGWNETDSCSNP